MVRKNVIDKDFTYFSIIKEAITACESRRATSAQIFRYMTEKHPECFTELNAVTWKNNVRQLLSKCPEFVKKKKEKSSKLHYWEFVDCRSLFERNLGWCPGRNCQGGDIHRDAGCAGQRMSVRRFAGQHGDEGTPSKGLSFLFQGAGGILQDIRNNDYCHYGVYDFERSRSSSGSR